MSVVCSRRVGGVGGGDERETFVSHEFPCNQYATLPALVLELLSRLDIKLEERKVGREGQSSF